MSLQLPAPIDTFFKASNASEDTQLAHCFTHDAVVRDEGHTHQGHAAIQAWLHDTRLKYDFRAEPLAITQQEQAATVLSRVTGNFPGSPVQLEYVFALAGDRIASLEIHG